MGHLRPRGAVDFSVLSRFALDIVGVPHLDSYGITSSRGPCIPNPGTARSNERPRWMTGRARPSSRVRGTFLNPEERGGGVVGAVGRHRWGKLGQTEIQVSVRAEARRPGRDLSRASCPSDSGRNAAPHASPVQEVSKT